MATFSLAANLKPVQSSPELMAEGTILKNNFPITFVNCFE